ncbi:MAG: NAD-dependent epimerase/dehydratase family protein [Gemmataceae bacterium]
MKVLVTGGGGFLGSAIVRLLIEDGYQVRSLARNRYPELAKLGVDQIQGDLSSFETVRLAAMGCDSIIHTAAKAGIGGRLSEYWRVNVQGTENVLQACHSNGISRLVHTSSPSVVFNGTDMEGVDESAPYPAHFEAYYPRTKAEAEKRVLAANGPKLATVALRPHLIWGPGDNHLVPRILDRGRRGTLRRIGKRNPVIDSTYIENAAQAHLMALKRLNPGSSVAGKVYFISNGEPIPTWDLVNAILAAGNLPPVRKHVPVWLAIRIGWLMEIMYRLYRSDAEPPMTRFLAQELSTSHWFDLSAARRDLDYIPRVSISEGLRRLKGYLNR